MVDGGVIERALEVWPHALEAACARCRVFRQVRVIRETASTQDAALQLGAPVGSLVTAGRQVGGRGRLGAAWADTVQDGVACTFVVEPTSAERLAMTAAVAVVQAARACVPSDQADRLGLKWPNDLQAAWPDGGRRKVAGVLVEIRDGRALVGIGVNVRQEAFPGPLAHKAASLHMLGGTHDRLHTIERLLEAMDQALAMDVTALEDRYRRFDRTLGQRMRFVTPAGEVEGEVLRCDPARGLEVQGPSGPVWLPAATTRVHVDGPSDRSTLHGP